VAECAIKKRLDRPQYPIPDREWRFYHLDQRINDRGLPIDRTFVANAMRMAEIRKRELTKIKRDLTGLINPNSGPQFLPWVRERGYPFADLKKDSVKKVLAAHKLVERGELKPGKNVLYPVLDDECVEALLLHQQTSRTSTTKYASLAKAVGEDGRMRFVFQFAGASRTARFAGRRFQPQNLTTMRDIENPKVLSQMTDVIRNDDYEELGLYRKEPLDALAGLVRSSVRAKKNKKLVVCDLSSIESVVIGWVSGCERLLNVFRDGKDAYKDFATELFKVTYDEVTKDMRKMAKPATLGAGYRLGGGDMSADGKRTGLWGYAENMGIDMSRKEAHKSVAIFRRVYKEIVNTWYALENAIMRTIRTHQTTTVGPITFSYAKPYLVCHLPSGRNIYYLKPRVEWKPFKYRDKDTGKLVTTMKDTISYMGKQQNGSAWIRVYSHGGKFIENIVQAVARDILREGLIIADEMGFNIIGHVHDEIICEEAVNDNEHGLHQLRVGMIRKIRWAKGMPLNAAGHEGKFYFKS
jgi:DNA polymerase